MTSHSRWVPLVLTALLMLPGVAAAPANDDLANATPLSFNEANMAFASVNTNSATLEAGEPTPCGDIGGTVWFTATAPGGGAITVGTEGTIRDTVIAIYKGSAMNNLVLQECNDDTAGFQSRATADVDPGETVLIQVGGYNGGTGATEINAEWAPVGSIGSLGGAANFIQPGDSLSANGAGCTSNFVYDGAGGKVYLGTAAHCYSAGASINTPGYPNFGIVAFEGEAGNPATDFQLIEVKPEFHSFVRAAMKGHPEYPTGYTTASETRIGDAIQASGYGMGFGFTQVTQEKRQGLLYSDNAKTFRLNGPLVQDDSGGPLVHIESGKALGLVSQFGVFNIPPTTDVGPTIEGALAYAADNGYAVTLRTV